MAKKDVDARDKRGHPIGEVVPREPKKRVRFCRTRF
jgi:hypothetical protein